MDFSKYIEDDESITNEVSIYMATQIIKANQNDDIRCVTSCLHLFPGVLKDLVAWVTTGFLHIPHSEDIPNTVTVGNGGGVLLRPHNYFDEDPSIHSADSVYIEPGAEEICESNGMACLAEENCSPMLEPFIYNGFDQEIQ